MDFGNQTTFIRQEMIFFKTWLSELQNLDMVRPTVGKAKIVILLFKFWGPYLAVLGYQMQC